jgi:hypothetical protein
MTKGILNILAVGLAVLAFESMSAEGDAPPRRPRQPGGLTNQASTILKHADELGLTAEQKGKLEIIAKGAMSVLNEDQKKKATEIILAEKPEQPGGRRPKPADGEKKPEGKKPEEK